MVQHKAASPTTDTTLPDPGFTVSDDGYVRLLFKRMSHVRLEHLISGFDEDMPVDDAAGAMLTAITGYTEWISKTHPAITLGWDWQLSVDHSHMQIIRVSEPRFNVMLLDGSNNDLGFVKTSAMLEIYIDAFDWQTSLQNYLHIDCID